MRITRSQALRRHRKMWRWLAENPEAGKWEWPKWLENGGPYDYGIDCSYCHLCYYMDFFCESCPVIWGGDPEAKCSDCGSEYEMWNDHFGYREVKSKLAAKIANLPRRRNRK